METSASIEWLRRTSESDNWVWVRAPYDQFSIRREPKPKAK